MIVQFKGLDKDRRLLWKIFCHYPLGIFRFDDVWYVLLYFTEISFRGNKNYRISEREYGCPIQRDWDTPEEDAAWKNL